MGKPISKFQFGKVTGTVWENDYKGEKSVSFSFQKSYKDKDGNWQNVGFFNKTDLRDLGYLVDALNLRFVKELKKTADKEDKPVTEMGKELSKDEVPEDLPF